jgi:hypothetical protein
VRSVPPRREPLLLFRLAAPRFLGLKIKQLSLRGRSASRMFPTCAIIISEIGNTRLRARPWQSRATHPGLLRFASNLAMTTVIRERPLRPSQHQGDPTVEQQPALEPQASRAIGRDGGICM